MFFFNSLYIQRVLGYGPLKAGLAFLPFTGGIMVSAGIASQYAAKLGVRLVASVGIVITTIGLVWLTQIPVHGTYVRDVLPPILLTSFGMGLVFVVLTLVATTGLDDSDQGLASGIFNTSQQIGGALGLAILATAAASHSGGGTQKAGLVHGFHWAFAGSAVFLVGGLVVLVGLLRRRDVERIQAAAETAPVMGA
jgi:MFS family permease